MELEYKKERIELAAAFQWTAKLNLHEGVANHFSLSVDGGQKFLINPNQKHFSLIKASDLLCLSINDDPNTLKNAPDPTAWGLHSSLHKFVKHARCVMHIHSIYSTVLSSLKDSYLKPIDQNTAMFFNRMIVDEQFGGLAFENEGKRCSQYFKDPKIKSMVMGNHGLLILGDSVADAFNRMYYFERAAETYVKALQTGQELRLLNSDIAEKTAEELDNYPNQADAHFQSIKEILIKQKSDFQN